MNVLALGVTSEWGSPKERFVGDVSPASKAKCVSCRRFVSHKNMYTLQPFLSEVCKK